MPNILLDTNVILDYYDTIFNDLQDDLIVHSIVLEELDNILHSSQNEEKRYKARQARNAIKQAKNKTYNCTYINFDEMPIGWDVNKNDNKLLVICQDKGYKLCTNDLAMQLKAESLGVQWQEYKPNNEDEIYTGYKEVYLDEYELADFYEHKIDKWDLIPNQYLLIHDKLGKLVDKYKFIDKEFKPIIRKNMKSDLFGTLKPKDEYQELCFDSLISDQFSIITGRQGSGKTLLALMYCLWAIQTGKYNKVVILYNPTKVRGASDMGFYTGNCVEKGFQNSIGNMLNTKFGDKSIVNNYIAQDQIQLVSMADCRGMEIPESNILYIPEAQNTTLDLLKICLSRVSEDAKCIIEGDHLNQVDLKCFEGRNNGLARAIEAFQGQDFVSYVHLKNIWRSKIAAIADQM